MGRRRAAFSCYKSKELTKLAREIFRELAFASSRLLLSNAVTPEPFHSPAYGVGRGRGVPRGRGVGVSLPGGSVAVGVGVGVPAEQVPFTLNTMCMFGKPMSPTGVGSGNWQSGALR